MNQLNWATELREFSGISPRKSLSEEAADTLREFILLGNLEPGLPMSERDLADALGISRTPLKEALRILENEGLVVYGKTRRPRVADPSLQELAQNLLVLGSLEALAGELACQHATDNEIDEAVRLERLMGSASDDTEPLQFFQWDMDFHKAIVSASRNEPLLDIHKTLNARLWRARFISSKMRTGRDSTLGQHEDIREALVARDAKECGKQMRRHLETAITNIAATQALIIQKRT